MKGVILAGGKGTRLLPATRVVNKHMIPILNTPMIVYPLKTLVALGMTDILIVSGGNHIGGIAEFLGDGSDYGVRLTYRVQREAGGIAQALGLAEDFAQGEGIWVILGDNIFENTNPEVVTSTDVPPWHAKIFLATVDNPQRFGVYSDIGGVRTIEEKPSVPKSTSAVTGLYYYPNNVFEEVKKLKPSGRGELEITDLNNYYLDRGELEVFNLTGFWSDAGTPESLYEAISWAKNS